MTHDEKLNGTIQIDEAYVSGMPKNMHEKRRRQIGQTDHKTAILGMLETGTREVRAHVVPNAKQETLQTVILDRVGFGSTLHTDIWAGYDRMDCGMSMNK